MSAISYVSYISAITGFALIGIGIVMAIFEMTIKPHSQREKHIIRRVSYPSVIIIGIGVILVIVGIISRI
jgi:uncharacterized membrane protein YidH (DUF202 family)